MSEEDNLIRCEFVPGLKPLEIACGEKVEVANGCSELLKQTEKVANGWLMKNEHQAVSVTPALFMWAGYAIGARDSTRSVMV
jgi:hypothetical protein